MNLSEIEIYYNNHKMCHHGSTIVVAMCVCVCLCPYHMSYQPKFNKLLPIFGFSIRLFEI